MVIAVRNLEWLNHNSIRAYPLAADATQQDTTGTFTLPKDFLVSLYLPVVWVEQMRPGAFFLKRLVADRLGYRITIGYAASGGDVDVAVAIVTRTGFAENSVYNLVGVGDHSESQGHLVIGSLDNIALQPVGDFVFTLADGRLEPDAIRPQLRSVTGIQVDNGGELSSIFRDTIRLQAGRNFRLTPILAAGEDPRIVLDAIDGAGLTETCVCDDETAEPIRSINGVTPGPDGNLVLQGNQCLEIEAGEGQLLLRDTCSQPCCGCSELEVVTSALETLRNNAVTLETFLTNLEARTTQMDQIVLGSRLGDRGCTPPASCE